MPSIIRLKEGPLLGESSAPDVAVADHLEYRQEAGSAKTLPNRFPNVEELQSAACRFCGNVQPNQRAQVRAVGGQQSAESPPQSLIAGRQNPACG